jgi:hypothetical protein
MIARREFVKNKRLPPDFNYDEVEVIVLPKELIKRKWNEYFG